MTEDVLGGILGKMETLAEELHNEEEEEQTRLEEERLAKEKRAISQLSEKILDPKVGRSILGKKSRKPITDAFLKAITPDEIATLVAKSARAGREWAIRLYVQYIQTPETLNRIGGEEDGEPVKIERLLATARSLGVDMDSVVKEAEARLRGEYAVPLPDSPLGSVVTPIDPAEEIQQPNPTPSVVPASAE